MDPNDLNDGQDPSNQDPANAPGDNGEGEGADPSDQDVSQLPEWAQKRLKGAEGAISDLKQAAGAKSVKELKDRFSKKPDPKAAPKPKAEEAKDPGYVTREEVALFNQGYTPEELAIAKSLKPGVGLTEAVKDGTVSAAIDGVRAKQRTEKQIPEPSSRVPVAGNKTFKELKPEEQKSNYAKSVDTLIKKGRQNGRGNVGA